MTTYILKSGRGTPVFSFDNLERARQEVSARKKKGIKLRIFEVRTIETEIE